jgi:hypothetical protein
MVLLVWRCADGNVNRLAKNVLERLNSESVLVSTYSADTLVHKVKLYCEAAKVKDDVCLLLEIWNRNVIDALSRILMLPGLVRRPRIVVVSSLLTWAGRRYEGPISNINEEFCNRRPIAGAEDAWKTENCLWNIASKTKTEVLIVGTGLLYGLAGFDFAQLFRYLSSAITDIEIYHVNFCCYCRGYWLQLAGSPDTSRIASTLGGKNRVPMIHIEDAVELIFNSVRYGNTFQSSYATITTNSNSPRLGSTLSATAPATSPNAVKIEFEAGPTYIPATDSNDKTLLELFPSLQCCTTGQELMDMIFEADSEEVYFWNTDMWFPQAMYSSIALPPEASADGRFPQGISQQFNKLWTQYLSANKLNPVKVVVVGGPKTGKTSVAQEIATRSSVHYF